MDQAALVDGSEDVPSEPRKEPDNVKELADKPSVVTENAWKLPQFLNCLVCCGRNPTEVQEVEEIVVGVESQERMLVEPEIPWNSCEVFSKSDPARLNVSVAGTSSALVNFKPGALEVKPKCDHFFLNDNELYFNARKWRKGSKDGGDLIGVLSQYQNCLPRTTTIVLSDGSECVKIMKHHDVSVGLSILKLEDCSLGIAQLSEILLFCLNLNDVTLTMSDNEYDFHYDPKSPSIGAPDDQVSLFFYEQDIKCILGSLRANSTTSSARSTLRRIKLHFPLAKACSVALMIFNGVYGKSLELDTLEISYSQRHMIRTLNLMDSEDTSETLMQDAIALDCLETLANSRLTLRKLSLSCQDQFPLDWLRDVSENGENINVFIFLKAQVTRGLLRTLTHLKENSLIFPQLEDLSLFLPLLRIIYATDFSQINPNLMVAAEIKDFVLCCKKLKRLTLEGIYTDREMIPWIKCSFDGPTGCLTDLGVTYNSIELKRQLHEYFDQIGSLGIIVDKNASGRDINAMINPSRRKKSRSFPSIGTLHIVNQLPGLKSFSIVALMNKFPKLSKLIIEEHGFSRASLRIGPGEPSSTQTHASQAKIGNKELNNIIKALNGTLCHLHLDCNLLDITDAGLTGSKSREPRTFKFMRSAETQVFPVSHLSSLTYLYLRGLGDGVTEISAKLCFADYLEFKKLRELHLFASNMSKVGRDLIKERFASQRDFILELE